MFYEFIPHLTVYGYKKDECLNYTWCNDIGEITDSFHSLCNLEDGTFVFPFLYYNWFPSCSHLASDLVCFQRATSKIPRP